MTEGKLPPSKARNRIDPVPAVLVVEDDPDHAALITAALERNRTCTIEVASSVATAFELVKTRSYQVLLVDYTLPDGYGMDLVDWVGDDCAVVVMTSHGSEDIAAEALRKGARDYVTKNALFQDVLPEVIERLLGNPETAPGNGQYGIAGQSAGTPWDRGTDLPWAIDDSQATPVHTLKDDVDEIREALLNVLGDTRQPITADQGKELRRALRTCQRLIEVSERHWVTPPAGPSD